MTLLSRLLVCSLFFGQASVQGQALDELVSSNEIHVVTNSGSLFDASAKKIKQVYMEGGAVNVTPITLSQGNKLRTVFNSTIIGLTESRINSYWAQMKFTGRAEPPLEFENLTALLDYLNSVDADTQLLAYLPANVVVPQSMRVIYTIQF